jgi:hypothetical protein
MTKNNDKLQQARRSYIGQSIIVSVVVIALVAVCTWKILKAPQLGIWRGIIPVAMWLWVGYAAWMLRKYYLRLNITHLGTETGHLYSENTK